MKKITKQLALCLMAFSLLAAGLCVNADAAGGYKFKYKKVTVSMNGKAKKLIKKMGDVEPKKSRSCVYGGDDYTYDGRDFVLMTYTKKSGGAQYVQSIQFKTSKVKTAEGIKLGSSEDKVKSKYGEDAAPVFGVYMFDKGKTRLSITVANGKVTGIEYTALL